MITPRGIVQKLVFEPFLQTLWLKHNPALFAEDEWIWTESSSGAFIFATFEKAEEVGNLLIANGEEHVKVVVYSERRDVGPAPATRIALQGSRGDAKPVRVLRSNSSVVTRMEAQARWEEEHDGE